MKLQRKIIFTSFFLYVLLVVSLMVLLYVSLISAKEMLLTESSDLIEELEFERIQHDNNDHAVLLHNMLDHYYDDILILRDRITYELYSSELSHWVAEGMLYPEKENYGLPGYGYIHPEYGAFADYDLLGIAGPWLPKRVVDRALQDEQFKEEISHDLDLLVSITPILEAIFRKNESRLILDLIWIVFDNGATNTYPPYDYLSIIAENPDVIDLNESENDYVRLLNPENNPVRNILWLDPYFDEYRLEWMTGVVAPLYLNNTFIGTVGEDILLSEIISTVSEIEETHPSYRILFDLDNHAIVFPQEAIDDFIVDEEAKIALQELLKSGEDQEWSEQMLLQLEKPMQEISNQELHIVLDNIELGDSGIFTIELNETKKIIAFSKIEGIDWVVVCVLPYDEIITASTDYEVIVSQLLLNIRSNYWIFLLFGFIFVTIISLLRYFEVIRPLMILTDHMSEIGKKKQFSKIQSDKLKIRDDEIGILTNTFNLMIESLDEVRKQVIDINENLEERVKERTEDLNKANKKLLELDRMKDEFLNVSSHELKTPLIPIKAQLQLLLAGDYGELRPDQKKSLEMILRNEERLNTLASDVLDISKIQSNKLKLEKEQVNLEKIIRDEVEQFVSVAKDKDLSIVFENKSGQSIEVIVDIRRIQQVISNLISNAIKFTPELGKISVILGREGKNALIKVIDTGIGINEEDIERIFEPFFQVESGLIRKFGGTGLGLSICKGIVEAHGGKIWVESEGAGMGTTFSFTLPLSH